MKRHLILLWVVLLLFLFACSFNIKNVQTDPSVPNDVNGDEIIVREIKEAVTMEKMIDRLYESGYQSYLKGRYANAIMEFEVARILGPDKMEFWKKLALSYCYVANGRYKDAQQLGVQLMNEKADYWGSYMNAGLALLWQGKINQAIKYLEMADDFDAHEPTVNFYLGFAYSLLNKKVSAKKEFEKAISAYKEIMVKNPADVQAYVELAYLYLYRNQNIEEVKVLIQSALVAIKELDDPDMHQIWLDFYLPNLRGMYFFKNGEYRQSIMALGEAVEKAPSGIQLDLAENYYFLGKNYAALKDTKRAIQFFKRALATDRLIMYSKEIQNFLRKHAPKKGVRPS